MQIPKGGIAFFDSGIGGLTVLAECKKRMPDEIFYYYGDNAHAPYGTLPRETIFSYTQNAFAFFEKLNVRGAVLACNTATAICAERLRQRYAFPIIGAEPAILPSLTPGGKTLVLATPATIESARFSRLRKIAQTRCPTATLVCTPCPTLAGEIETHLFDEGYDYTKNLPTLAPNAVVLGCTHYIYIKKRIHEFYNAPVYDGNEGIANRLRSLLCESPVLKKNRDGQPPLTAPNGFTPQKGQRILRQDAFQGKISAPIFFLGTGIERCYTVYEQMFANPYNKRDCDG